MTDTTRLRYRTAGAVGWSIARFGGDQLIGFVVFAVLARLLVPAQFGVFIVTLAVAEIGKIIAQGGLVSSLYRAPTITPRLADTVFWANVGMGLLFALICLVLRHPLADALGSPGAAPVLAAIGFTVPVSAAGASHMSRNLRDFGHRALAVRSLVAGVIGGGLALAAASAGWGVWTLVVQRFAQELIGTIVAWRAFRWRPGFDFSWHTLRTQLGLGASVASSQLLLVLLNRTQDVIVSRMIGIGAVGVYRTGWKSIEVIAQGVISPFSTVTVPTLVKLKHDMAAYRRGYLKMASTCALVAFPAIAGVGATADTLIPLLYGPQWAQSVPVARVLCLLALPFTLNFFADPALTVLGRSVVIARLALAQLLLTLVLCIAAAPYGLFWFAVAYVSRAYATLALQLALLQRATGIRAIETVRAIAPPLIATIGMAAIVFAIGRALPMATHEPVGQRLLRMTMLVGAGGLVYPALLLPLLGRDRRREFIELAAGFVPRRAARA